MSVEKTIKLRPIRVPNYIIVDAEQTATRKDGFPELPTYHISELDRETLIDLADEFKTNLLRKAGKL